MSFVLGLFIIFVLACIYIAVRGIVIVKQDEVMVIEHFGKFKEILHPGMHVLIPMFRSARSILWRYLDETVENKIESIQKRTNKIPMHETLFDIPPQDVITSDNVYIEIDALLYFQVTDPKRVVYEIDNLPASLEKLTQSFLRNIIGGMKLDKTLDSRKEINDALHANLADSTGKWGIQINRVELEDIKPTEEVLEAMELVMRAEREKRAAVTQAEGKKEANMLESQGEQSAIVNRAEGEKRGAILKSEGEAYARIRIAQAEAEAIRRISEALSDNHADPTKYLVAIRYLDSLKEMVQGKDNKVIYVPYEATGVLSSLGGIRELFQDLNPEK